MGFAQAGFAQLAEDIPREKTFIADVLTGRVGTPANFNVFTTAWRNPDRGVQQLMLEPLWLVDYVTGEVINALAAEGPIYNEDFTQMTVKLREGCQWSDGVPITADDIVYGIELCMQDSGMSYNAPFNLYVDKVYKTDDYTVVFEFKEPNARFHANFIDRWGGWRPFPKHIFEEAEDPLSFDFNPPISSGPYVLKDFDQAGYWTLWERREDWDKTPTGILYGMPQPEYVLFYYYGDAANKVIAQANHNLDMTDLTMEAFRAILERNEYSRGYRKEYPWVVNVDPCMTGLTLNNDVSPFDLKDVRWALTLAIDIVDYIGIAFDGAAPMGVLHVPPTPVYQEWYYKPLEEWLKNLTLDIEIDGEPFKPYDPEAPFRLVEYVKERGYDVPKEPEAIREMFGPGWWKYAPDVAEQLLLRNGFTKDANGKWLLPDGTPWKIAITAHPSPSHPQHRNSLAAAQQWRNFGIDVTVNPSEAYAALAQTGDYVVNDNWPAIEPWGGHPDLYRVLSPFRTSYYRPIGEQAVGHSSRWYNEKLDKVIEEMEKVDWDSDKNLQLGMEGLKILVEEMPTIPTFGYPGVVAWDEYYWTNYPGAENPYTQPYHHWPNFKYMLPFLRPVER
ncbi:MAG: ABC transporter substrate-binding protein [Atribacterota bacterium]|jgi:peptide/nickel transport system substrate-binding protein|nr:ABC transporter substrate-binding protein [Atribacterota bacterium]MDI9606882.1 ABC transporter substrate-binding protein [Atribacterota bacterium]MDY0135451.1 ABC transporter substrate-binding protein [Atribacterota bacterium]HOA99010.1 ABC transporter substrate-binding protein [Candidatus Atribacteria bacterium]